MYLKIESKLFSSLLLHELYDIMKLRSDVFLIEQNIKESEFDCKDFEATHHFVKYNDEIVGYARSYGEGKIKSFGRLVIKNEFRNLKIGQTLVKSMIAEFRKQKIEEVLISAQYQVRDFYQKLAFEEIGKPYLEAGIKHIKMRYQIA